MKLNTKTHLAQAKWSMTLMGCGQGDVTVTEMDEDIIQPVINISHSQHRMLTWAVTCIKTLVPRQNMPLKCVYVLWSVALNKPVCVTLCQIMSEGKSVANGHAQKSWGKKQERKAKFCLVFHLHTPGQ